MSREVVVTFHTVNFVTLGSIPGHGASLIRWFHLQVWYKPDIVHKKSSHPTYKGLREVQRIIGYSNVSAAKMLD